MEADLDSRLRRLRLLRSWLVLPGMLVGFAFLANVVMSLVLAPANVLQSWLVLSTPYAVFWCVLAVASWVLLGRRMARLQSGRPAASP